MFLIKIMSSSIKSKSRAVTTVRPMWNCKRYCLPVLQSDWKTYWLCYWYNAWHTISFCNYYMSLQSSDSDCYKLIHTSFYEPDPMIRGILSEICLLVWVPFYLSVCLSGNVNIADNFGAKVQCSYFVRIFTGPSTFRWQQLSPSLDCGLGWLLPYVHKTSEKWNQTCKNSNGYI